MDPVEIDNIGWQLRDWRDRINLVPIPENVITDHWRKKEIWIKIGLFRVVYDIALIIHLISHYVLFAT